MKTHSLIYFSIFLLSATPCLASDSVSAADSEDINAFDAALSVQRKAQPSRSKVEAGDSGADSAISNEAGAMKNQIQSGSFKNYGQSVADQRRNSNGKALSAGASAADQSPGNRGGGNGATSNNGSNKAKRNRGKPQ